MNQPGFLAIVGFGPEGWGGTLIAGAAVTIAVALCGFGIGQVIGALGAWAKVLGGPIARGTADVYTTVLRGLPDLLVIYVVYFGGSAVLSDIAALGGGSGFVSFPGFIAGALAVGLTSGAQQVEVLRGGFSAVQRSEIEAAMAVGMPRFLRFRRIVAPLVLRYALPGLGNAWLSVLKESSLLAVTGVAELMREAQVAAGSTNRPFDFFIAAGILYLVLATTSGLVVSYAERHFSRGARKT